MCNAMSQGNDGSMATLHASGPRGSPSPASPPTPRKGSNGCPWRPPTCWWPSAVHFVVHLARGHRPDHPGWCPRSARSSVPKDRQIHLQRDLPPRHRPARLVRWRGRCAPTTSRDLARYGFDPVVLEQPRRLVGIVTVTARHRAGRAAGPGRRRGPAPPDHRLARSRSCPGHAACSCVDDQAAHRAICVISAGCCGSAWRP